MALTEGQSVDPAVFNRYRELANRRAGSRHDYVVKTPGGDKVIEVYVMRDGRFGRHRSPSYIVTLVRDREPSLYTLREGNTDEVFPYTQIVWQRDGANGKDFITKKVGIATRPENDRDRPTEREVTLGPLLQGRVEDIMHRNTATEELLLHIQLLSQVGSLDRISYKTGYLKKGTTRRERWWGNVVYFRPQSMRYEAKNPF